jgi:ribosomal protein S18 acetylase RimI-like enzyme
VFRDVRLAALHEAPYAFGSRWEVERKRGEAEWRGAVARRSRFVAEIEGRVVGMAALGDSISGRAAEITSVWVDPGSRGRGVGDGLMEAVLEAARTAAYSEVRLWVTEGNTAAERLYARHGFVRSGDVKPVGEDDDRVELEMRLGL